ncbi:ead/Ea22-like family protein [Salmonella enterica subsp. enterica serovar Newport]|nr:ead/Ea22-like family protein [Salmonella enterica subsp. enterica serovar Newport]
MSNIDKQELREAAEKADSGEWSYEEINRLDLPGGASIKINGRGAVYCLKKPVGGVEQSRTVTAFIAAFNPKVALALLDENLQLQREKDAIEAVALAMRDDMRQAREQLEAAEKRNAEQREYYEGVIADGGKRIAELEARTVNLPKRRVGEVMRMSGFSRDYAEGWCAGNDNAIHEIRAAGIKVKGA